MIVKETMLLPLVHRRGKGEVLVGAKRGSTVAANPVDFAMNGTVIKQLSLKNIRTPPLELDLIGLFCINSIPLPTGPFQCSERSNRQEETDGYF